MKYGDPRNNELHFVYRVFRADGAVLYVGCTRQPEVRFNQHRRQAEWWDQADRAEWIPAGRLHDAQRLEEQTIKADRPLYNFQHNSRSAREAVDLAAEPAWRRAAFKRGACRLCADAETASHHPGVDCVTAALGRLRDGGMCERGMDHAMRVLERATDARELEAAS